MTIHTPFSPSLKSSTRADMIVQELADQIVNGGLEPGVRLDESNLAERFHVSRTPVREALRQLSAMGLVEKKPHRGVIVINIPATRLDEMFQVMAELEAVCSRLAAGHMTAGERQELEAFHHAMEVLVRESSTEEYALRNREFHSMIYRGAHNQFLENTVRTIRHQVGPYRKAQFQVSARLRLSHEEHGRVVQAILRGDANLAEKTMRDHLLTVGHVSARFAG